MMKMIIILTNKADVTSDFVVRELRNQRLEYYRLNTEDIPQKIDVIFSIEDDKFVLVDKIKNIQIDLSQISAVYFRRAQVAGLEYLDEISEQEREYLRGELAYLLEGIYKILENRCWLNNIYKIREAENKIYQLQMARELGFIIPTSLITNIPETVISMVNRYNKDCIIKPIKSGNVDIKTSSKIIFTSQIEKDFYEDKTRIADFPVYLQENIHKRYDLRCIVIGKQVYCAQIESQEYEDSRIDWRRGKSFLKHIKHELPNAIKEKCIEMTKKLGLKYSAIDLILDNTGKYIFLECNPNGQWAWLEIRLGFPISKEIVNLLSEGSR